MESGAAATSGSRLDVNNHPAVNRYAAIRRKYNKKLIFGM
jgi:hypothetical protein